MANHHDVIILGAGFNGLIAAKTYLQIKPSIDILILDSGDAIGGVWSKSRIYPGLLYEMPTPLLNFSDFDMCKELGMEMWEDVNAAQVNEFLLRYAKKHDLPRLCQLDTKVTTVERHGRGWKVFCRPINDEKDMSDALTCDKLIVATGVTSNPGLPPYDMSRFEGTCYHSVELGRRHPELLSDKVQHVTVIGGHKSALEVVGLCAQAGKKVEWLVRKEGGGPTWLMPSKNPEGSSMAKASTKRILSIFGPSVYDCSGFFNRFFYSTRWWLGTWLIQWFYSFLTKTMLGDKYKKSKNGNKLKPHPKSIFWFVPGGTIVHGKPVSWLKSLLGHIPKPRMIFHLIPRSLRRTKTFADRDLETLRLIDEENLIRVNRAHLISAESHSVTVSTGEKVTTDAVIFCTGWELSNPPLFSPSLAYELGLPSPLSEFSKQEANEWSSLDCAAEAEIEKNYPVLKTPPKDIYVRAPTDTQFRLFRHMVPAKYAVRGDSSILFLGNWATGRVQISGEIASLWGVAWLENLLPPATRALVADKDKVNGDIARVEAFRRKRYLNATPFRLSILETPEYESILLRDVGVRADRKRMKMPSGWRDLFGLKSYLVELFESYFACDYEGIIDEFLAARDQGMQNSSFDGSAGERTPLMNGHK